MWTLINAPVHWQRKSEGFDCCDRPVQSYSNWIQIVNLAVRVALKFNGWPRKMVGHRFYTTSNFGHHFKSIGEFNLELKSKNAKFGSKLATFCPVWPWYLMNDLENNRTPLLYCMKVCVSFQSQGWIQTRVTVRQRSIGVIIGDFLSRVTLKFDEWPWKNNRVPLLYYIKLFTVTVEFKLELQSESAQIWVKIGDFFSCVTLKFDDWWPWQTIGHLS